MRPVRIAVIGVGYMGTRHAQKVATLAETTGDVELAGVADIDVKRAHQLAKRLGTRGVSSTTVAASTSKSTHSRLTKDTISAGSAPALTMASS